MVNGKKLQSIVSVHLAGVKKGSKNSLNSPVPICQCCVIKKTSNVLFKLLLRLRVLLMLPVLSLLQFIMIEFLFFCLRLFSAQIPNVTFSTEE